MKRLVLTATVASLALLAFPGLAMAQASGNQRFVVVAAGPPPPARVVFAVGPVSGVGTEVIESNPPGIATLRWIFPQGTLFVTATYASEVDIDPQTCLRTVILDGTWQITGGTGEYEGATGGGTFSGTNRSLGTRTPEGGCGPPAIVVAQVFQMVGNVELGDQVAA